MSELFHKGEKAPDFTLKNQDNIDVSLKDYEGSYLLLYFYPKDNTPGCTLESKDFTCLKDEFDKLGVKLAGVSKDSIKSHQNFIAKQELGVDLFSDTDIVVMKAYKAWGLKKNYGKEYEGVIRSTILIDQAGMVVKHWHNVRAKGHAERILKELNTLI